MFVEISALLHVTRYCVFAAITCFNMGIEIFYNVIAGSVESETDLT
jgi:hypothetical protein